VPDRFSSEKRGHGFGGISCYHVRSDGSVTKRDNGVSLTNT